MYINITKRPPSRAAASEEVWSVSTRCCRDRTCEPRMLFRPFVLEDYRTSTSFAVWRPLTAARNAPARGLATDAIPNFFLKNDWECPMSRGRSRGIRPLQGLHLLAVPCRVSALARV